MPATSVRQPVADRTIPRRGRRRQATVLLIVTGALALSLGSCTGATTDPSPADPGPAKPPVTPAVATPIPGPATPSAPPPPAGPVFEFTDHGTVLGPSDVGFSCCAPGNAQDWPGVSDESAVALPDGRIRLYFNRHLATAPGEPGKPFGIGSAISDDGIHFTVERGDRIAVGRDGAPASPFVFPLPEGGYRLFYVRGGDTVSATSEDGLTFTQDTGRRLAADAFTPPIGSPPICSAIARTGDGRYRMYCTQEVVARGPGPGQPGKGAVFSAVSEDLLEWTPDPGVRLGPGSELADDAGHPTVLRDSPDGPLLLVYHSYDYRYTTSEGGATVPRKSGTAEIIVTSTDGLSFTDPVITGVYGAEVAFASRPDGTGYLYYGRADQGGGARLGVATVEELSIGPALNFVDLPFPSPPGSTIAVLVSTSPGAACTVTVRDAAGKTLEDDRLAYTPVAGDNGIVSWTWQVAPGTAPGTATATATCTAGASRTREATFEFVKG